MEENGEVQGKRKQSRPPRRRSRGPRPYAYPYELRRKAVQLCLEEGFPVAQVARELGVGWMAGPACVAPHQSVELYTLCRRTAWDAAMELQRRLWNLNEVFAKYNLAACIKGGLELQGYPVGAPIPPQAPLPPDGVEEVRRALVAIGAL